MALTGHIVVRTEALNNQAGIVEGRLKEVRNSFDEMRNAVNGMAAYWTGEASEAHRKSYNAKMSKIDQMIRRYEEHVRDLRQMANVYNQAETHAQTLANELPASLLD